VAAEGQESLICLWIFRCFSSMSFRENPSFPVALSLRRERASLATLAQAVPSPLPLPNPSQAPGWKGKPPPIDLGGKEGGAEGALPWSPLRSKKPTCNQVGIFKVRGTRGR
jgi:hypothetical protein